MEPDSVKAGDKTDLSNCDSVSVSSYDNAIDNNHWIWHRKLHASLKAGPCGLSEKTVKLIVGVAVIIGIAVCWVGAAQLSGSLYSNTFFAPYFATWFLTSWIIICYPIVSIINMCKGRRFMEVYRESEKVYGDCGLCLMSIIKIGFPFCLLWVIPSYLYTYALGLIQSSDVTAMFSSVTAFVYVFSLLWLKESFLIVRAIATVISIAGIVLFAYAEGFGGFHWLGVILTIGASVTAALLRVWLKRVVGDATFNQIALFLSTLGMINFLLLWPIILILYYTGVETIIWDKLPMAFLCGSAMLTLGFNFLVTFGIALTFPLFVSLGSVVSIPLNAIVDVAFRQHPFDSIKVGGSACIVIAFLLILINDKKSREISDKIMYILCCKKLAQSCQEVVQSRQEVKTQMTDIEHVAT